MPVTLSYPKPRDLLTKFISLAVTDSSTEKCVLPKDAILANVICNQTVNATTDASSWVVGWSGATGAILNAFASATTKVGMVHPGTTVGTEMGNKLTADRSIISTCTKGASDTTSVVQVMIQYFIPGSGETLTS